MPELRTTATKPPSQQQSEQTESPMLYIHKWPFPIMLQLITIETAAAYKREPLIHVSSSTGTVLSSSVYLCWVVLTFGWFLSTQRRANAVCAAFHNKSVQKNVELEIVCIASIATGEGHSPGSPWDLIVSCSKKIEP